MSDEKPVTPAVAATPAAQPAPATEAPKKPFLNPHARKRTAAPAPATEAPEPPAAASGADEKPTPKSRAQAPARMLRELEVLKSRDVERLKLENDLKIAAKRLEGYAAAQFESLTDQQKAFVRSVAGKDPGAQIDLLNSMKANGLLNAPAAPKAPAHTAPSSAPAPKQEDAQGVLAQYDKLRATAPTLAQAFYLRNRQQIDAARRAAVKN